MGLDCSTRLLVIRHGETDWNREGRIQGHLDIPLSRQGQRQASALAEALDGEAIDALYCSDLQRAQQTARPLAVRRGIEPRSHPGLRERSFGRFEGLCWSDIRDLDPDAAVRWRKREPDFSVGGGESLSTFLARVLPCVEEIASVHQGGAVAVVTHGGVLDCLFRVASGLSLQAPRSWTLANATINRLLWSSGRLTLVGWGDDRHLDALR